jgi:hypothetical protein
VAPRLASKRHPEPTTISKGTAPMLGAPSFTTITDSGGIAIIVAAQHLWR